MIKVSAVYLCCPQEGECGFEDLRILEILDNDGLGDIEWGEIVECLNNSFHDYDEYDEGYIYIFQLKKFWDYEDDTTDKILHFEILTKEKVLFEGEVQKNDDSFHCEGCVDCLFECKKDKKQIGRNIGENCGLNDCVGVLENSLPFACVCSTSSNPPCSFCQNNKIICSVCERVVND